MEEILKILDELLRSNLTDVNKFYNYFGYLEINDDKDLIENIVRKTWGLIHRKVILKDNLYLCLLAMKNFKILQRCINLDKGLIQFNINDPHSLFDFTIYTKVHWLHQLIQHHGSNIREIFKTPILNNDILCSLLANLTNNPFDEKFSIALLQSVLAKIDSEKLYGFWIYYVKETSYILNIINFCKQISVGTIIDSEILQYASQNCILDIISHYIDIYSKHDYLEKMFLENIEGKIPHDEDFKYQLQTLASFSVLTDIIKVLVPISERKDLNVNIVIQDIKIKILALENQLLQLELLEIIFACSFLKKKYWTTEIEMNNEPTSITTSEGIFICNEKEIRLIMFVVKSVIDELKLKTDRSLNVTQKLNNLNIIVTDAMWRLELITNIKSNQKCNKKLLYYLLAPPESLINICLKNNDVLRASQVLKIFNLESSSLAYEIEYNEKLQELRENVKRTIKIREIQQTTPNMATSNVVNSQIEDIVETFFMHNPTRMNEETNTILTCNASKYNFLDNFKFDTELFMNILDLAITQTECSGDSGNVLHLASKYNTLKQNDSDFYIFSKKLLALFNEVGISENLCLANILLNPDIALDVQKHREKESFYQALEELYTEFCEHLTSIENGVLNSNHQSHKSILNLNTYCVEYEETGQHVKYLQKLFNYLKAFSKILFIEQNSSSMISQGKNTSYFELLLYNRSEITGKLLFGQNLDPTEFENYFAKLKLDFLYHVIGNCFPTINLHAQENITKEELYPENTLYVPNKAIVTYIQKRNWLLALILNEMYKVKDVEMDVSKLRIAIFINYMRLPKIQNLKAVFQNNEIITSLQNDISYQKLADYINQHLLKQDLTSSSHSSNSSFETAEEILEDGIKTTNWKTLFNIMESIPENQLKNKTEFKVLRDMVLLNLVQDACECQCHKYMLHISDRNLRLNLILENMKSWPGDFCIRSIKSEISRFQQVHDEKLSELNVWLKHIQHSKKIMTVLNIPTWSIVHELCFVEPKKVVGKLLACKQIDLVIEFIKLHQINNDLLLSIDRECVGNLFDLDVDLDQIQNLLDCIPYEHSINICYGLLNTLKNVKYLHFVINYLIRYVKDETLGNAAISLEILSVFSINEFDQQLLLLLWDPLSILEVLIMNAKLDKLGTVLDIIKPMISVTEFNENKISVEKIDCLLRQYAEKSLDFRVITQPNPRLLRTPECKLMQSLDSLNLDSSNRGFIMPEEVPFKDNWVGNTEVIECMCCLNITFSMFNRRHHCRRCGRVVCYYCSTKRMMVPTYGDILVRVCTDCYNQTFKDSPVSEENTSSKSNAYDHWVLTNDADHNRIVREEFSYEYAPSVSLCLSLMKFHSKCEEYSEFLLEQCKFMLKLLLPKQELLQEIDYLLVIKMLKSLAIAAKMSSTDCSIQYGSSLADRILSQAELLGLLAERGCLNLLPTTGKPNFIDALMLRRLRDKLLEREQWNLALEVSTKAGLDNIGVFVAWGKSCLKAGSLFLAREKFSKCLDKSTHHEAIYDLEESYQTDSQISVSILPEIHLKSGKNPPLLNEIIKILESKKESIDEELIKKIENQRLLGSTLTLNQSVTSSVQPDGPMCILNKLKNLKNIESGIYASDKLKNVQYSRRPTLEGIFYEECIYYLNKYGTSSSLVEFHIKYGQFEKALNFILRRKLSTSIFIEIYIRCLREGTVEILQSHMSRIDSTLDSWKEYLKQICFHLEKQRMLNCLYQLQQYIGDYVRAAMTCVRFYEENATSFSDLVKNARFLQKSEEHLKQALEQEQWVDVSTVSCSESNSAFEEKSITNPSLILKINLKDIGGHINTIRTQHQIAEFLTECENLNVIPMQILSDLLPTEEATQRPKLKVLTLFGPSDDRRLLAVLCIVCGKHIKDGFSLALRVINELKLKPLKVYIKSGKYLAEVERYDAIAELVSCIKETDTRDKIVTEMCDEMLILAVATLTKANASEANIEALIKLISNKTAKISAYIEANQLKTAYFLAVKYKRMSDIRRILREAELLNQPGIKTICQKALQSFAQSPSSTKDIQ